MENSREESPDLGKKKSRRKPVVTRKIEAEDEEQLETFDGETSFDLDQVMSEVDSNDRMDSKKIKFSRRHKINSEKKKEPTDSESESDTEVSSSHNKQTTKLSPKHQNGRQNKAVLENSSTLSKKTRSQNEQSDKSAKHKRHSSSRDSDHKIKKVQKVHQSDSSNYDSDLERDIERLAHVPQKSSKTSLKKQKKSESEGEEEVNKEQNQKAGRKVKQKDRRFEDLSSGEESESNQSVDEDTEDNNTDLQEAGDLALKALEEGNFFDLERDRSDDELITCESEARKAMLADHSSSSDSPDSDVDAILAKKLKGVSGSKGSSKSNSVHVSDTESTSTNKTSKKYNRLLDARLSDLEDIDSPLKSDKKDRGLEKDDSQSEDDLDNGHLSSDSDFAILSKSPKSTKKRGSDSESENKSEDSRGSDSDLSSDFEPKPKTRAKKKKSETSDSEVDSDESKNTKKKGKKRKRIKVASDSSDKSDEEGSEQDESKSGKKKKIRKVIKDNKLSQDTKSAARAEEERRERIKERQKLYNQVDEEDVNSPTKSKITTRLILEMDDETKEPLIQVNPKLIRKLKPHQVEAVRFLWDCCVESVDRMKKEDGSGCILAHCMGLGKTLSLIAFTHTLMTNSEETGVERALIVSPLNTVLNWQHEWQKWLDRKDQLDVYELSSVKDNNVRARRLEEWYQDGGIMILGYEMYRNLSTHRNVRKAKLKKTFTKTLVDPGPDVVVCDEGHVLRNDASALSKAMNKIRTRRRICLTGTPLQNNLVEYHCMIDFVKPKLLGTRKEFMNRFANPIKNGQCSDSTSHDVKLMKKRAHILHETLAGCVQRKDYSALTKFLPPKHEYVISVRLSEVQVELYEKYLNRVGHGPLEGEKLRSAQLFSDYQALMRIWTHPWVLKLQEIREENKRMMEDSDSFVDDDDSMNSFIDDSDKSDSESPLDSDKSMEISDDSEASYKQSSRSTRSRRGNDNDENGKSRTEVVKKWKSSSRGGDGPSRSETPQVEENGDVVKSGEWWAQHLSEDDRFNLEISGKISLLAEVLRLSETIGDKVLVFSQSLLSLDLIEDFLAHWDNPVNDSEDKEAVAGTMGWSKGVDYFRMDGSTNAQFRKSNADIFNDPDNVRGRLFLISTRAGCLGTNLVGANRVIIFDASWNPSHDTQSIFRVYRFGQTKPVYIYRFLAQGTMEEKIYERQVTKQSLSQRVVDEHQIERHFSNADLSELYNFKPDKIGDKPEDEYIHILPKDRLLADLLTEQRMWIVKYHEHDSLLENKVEEDLTEEERKVAWEEYEMEKKSGFRARPAMAPNAGQFYQHYNIQQGAGNMMYQQPSEPPNYSVQQIEQLARAIYAANPGLKQEDLQKHVQTYIQHQQIQFYQRQREQMRQQQQQQWLRQQQLAKLQSGDAQPQQGNASSVLRSLMTKPSTSSNQPAPKK